MDRSIRLFVFIGFIAGCDPVPLCRATGGEWDPDCFTCANPICADGVATHIDCPAVCGEGCRCPAEALIWDESAGCSPASICDQ